MIDDHSRIAYVEAHDDETKETAAAVLRNAVAWFADRGVTVQRVLSDNGGAYRSFLWRDTCVELGITPKRTRPYRPQTNGKIERFHRTLVEGWAFKKFYNSESARLAALPAWIHHYNHHRPHSAIGKRCTHHQVGQPGWASHLVAADRCPPDHAGALNESAQHFLESRSVAMARQSYQRLSPTDIDEIWSRLRSGHSVKPTARALGLPSSTVRTYLIRCGGIRPDPRHRAAGRLSLEEREEISRGLAAGLSLRAIAAGAGPFAVDDQP